MQLYKPYSEVRSRHDRAGLRVLIVVARQLEDTERKSFPVHYLKGSYALFAMSLAVPRKCSIADAELSQLEARKETFSVATKLSSTIKTQNGAAVAGPCCAAP